MPKKTPPKRIGLRIPPDLWRDVKVQAAKEGTTAQEIVVRTLEEKFRPRGGRSSSKGDSP